MSTLVSIPRIPREESHEESRVVDVPNGEEHFDDGGVEVVDDTIDHTENNRSNFPVFKRTGPLKIVVHHPDCSYRIEGDTKKYRSYWKDLGAVYDVYKRMWFFGIKNKEALAKKLAKFQDFVDKANAGEIEPTPANWQRQHPVGQVPVDQFQVQTNMCGFHPKREALLETPVPSNYQVVPCRVPRPIPGMTGYVPNRNYSRPFTVIIAKSTGSYGHGIIDSVGIQFHDGNSLVNTLDTFTLNNGQWVMKGRNRPVPVYFNI